MPQDEDDCELGVEEELVDDVEEKTDGQLRFDSPDEVSSAARLLVNELKKASDKDTQPVKSRLLGVDDVKSSFVSNLQCCAVTFCKCGRFANEGQQSKGL